MSEKAVIDPDLLAILGCPLHPERPPFRLEGNFLFCTMADHGFEIVNGIPHLLPESVIEGSKIRELTNER